MRIVANYDAVLSLIDNVCQPINNDTAERWFKTVFRKWVINKYAEVKELDPADFSIPESMQPRLDAGATLVEVNIDQDMMVMVDNIKSFMEADHTEIPRQFALKGEDWRGISVPDMVRRTNSWMQWEERRAKKRPQNYRDDNPGDVELIAELSDGYKLVRLVTQDAFIREGALMSHCIADDPHHFEQSGVGVCSFYSISDHNNIPHITFTTYNDTTPVSLYEVQGYADHAPAER